MHIPLMILIRCHLMSQIITACLDLYNVYIATSHNWTGKSTFPVFICPIFQFPPNRSWKFGNGSCPVTRMTHTHPNREKEMEGKQVIHPFVSKQALEITSLQISNPWFGVFTHYYRMWLSLFLCLFFLVVDPHTAHFVMFTHIVTSHNLLFSL